jgi:DMSO reductase family type II enzyme heme b subunit
MKKTIELIAAPPGMSPGGYIAKAYEDRTEPSTPQVTAEMLKTSKGWHLSLSWPCPDPVNAIAGETDLFMDSAAILVPLGEGADLFTMGSPDAPVEGAFWRAEADSFHHIRATGPGSVERREASRDWNVTSAWKDGIWTLDCAFLKWPALEASGRFAIAVWRGADKDRGGLKSLTPDWISAT